MIIPDSSLLLYAYNSSSPWHKPAADWWAACLNGDEPIGLVFPVLFAFLRVGTNPRSFPSALSVEVVAQHVGDWFGRRIVRLLSEDPKHFEQVVTLLTDAESTAGNLTTDAQIAAIAIAHQATVHTNDRDFQRFKGLKTFYPLD